MTSADQPTREVDAESTPAGRPVRGRPARYSPEELLAIVVGVFNERGYDATSMADLAVATGLTKSALYHHVAGKEEFLRLAVAQALDALFAALDEAADGPAVDRLAQVVRGSAVVLAEQLPYVTLLLRVRGNTAAERWALQRRREFDRRIGALVQEAIDADDLRADLDPRVVSRLLFGMVNSLTEWWRPGGAQGPAEVAQAVIALAFDGLRRRPLQGGRSRVRPL